MQPYSNYSGRENCSVKNMRNRIKLAIRYFDVDELQNLTNEIVCKDIAYPLEYIFYKTFIDCCSAEFIEGIEFLFSIYKKTTSETMV